MALWIKTSVRYEKVMENGTVKKVTEPYLVDALSFTEAEARIIEEVTQSISGEFNVSAVAKTKVSEIFFDETGDRWYQVKIVWLTVDENTGADKRTQCVFMVQASDFKEAYDNFLAGMKGTMADYEIISITETNIVDVIRLK